MTNAEIIEAVNRWQSNGMIHPLTCGNNSQWHTILRPVEADGRVVLVCPDCDYRQVLSQDLIEILTGTVEVKYPWPVRVRPDADNPDLTAEDRGASRPAHDVLPEYFNPDGTVKNR
jgi:hypothetical protein